MASHYNRQDYFSDLPAELIINIVARLPSSQYLAVSHISISFRALIKEHAKAIVNEAIRVRFPEHIKFLGCELVEGWLTPTLTRLSKLETDIMHVTIIYLRVQSGNSEHKMAWDVLDLSVLEWGFNVKVSNPGPQLLYILEKNAVVDKAQGKELMINPVSFKPLHRGQESNLGSFYSEKKPPYSINQNREEARYEPHWYADSLDFFSTIHASSINTFGISPVILGNCLQELNDLKHLPNNATLWYVDLPKGATRETRPKPLTWYSGVPSWFVSKPSDPIWDKWDPKLDVMENVTDRTEKATFKRLQIYRRARVPRFKSLYRWFPAS